jgi:phosphocarrier protein
VLQRTVTVVNKLGLHARPAAKVAQTASRFTAEVRLRYGDLMANAKSILGVMALAVRCGDVLTLEADGPDAQAALEALAELFAGGFGE